MSELPEAVFENEFSQDGPVVSSPTITAEQQAVQEAEAAAAAETAAQEAAAEAARVAAAASPENNGAVQGAEPSSGAEKRIHQLTKQREEERVKREAVEREAAILREQLAARTAAPAPAAQPAAAPPELQAPVAPVEPNLDDFPEDYDGYLAAERAFKAADRVYIKDLAKFELLTEFQQRQSLATEQQRAAQAQEHQVQTEATFKATVDKATEDDPNFRYLPFFSDTTLPVSQLLFNEVKASTAPVELIRFLSLPENRAEAARLSALPHNNLLRELGRIEAQITVTKPPTPKLVSGAPEPIVPLNASSAANLSGEDSDDLFFAKEAAKFK